MEAGSSTVIVDPAVDIWALGVIAFELLTEEPAFSAQTMSAAKDAIAGGAAAAGAAAEAAADGAAVPGAQPRRAADCLGPTADLGPHV